MIFSASLISVCLVALPWLFVINMKNKLKHLILMDHGMCYINHVERALEHLPQHRGMANAFLNGDQSFQDKMHCMQKRIADDINAIEDCMIRHPLPTTLTSRWEQIKHNWSDLKQDLNNISPNESFERHTAVITDILSLISDSADDMRISAHPEQALQKIAQTAFNLLPTTIEVIGQSRGIGTGAAAKGNVATSVRIKLKFLHDRLSKTLATTQHTIEACLSANSAQFQLQPQALSSSVSNTQHFIDTISSNMLASEKPQVSADEYFAIGSKAFDSNIELFKTLSSTLGDDLSLRIPKLKKQLWLSIAISSLLSLCSVVVWQQYIVG